MYRRGIFAVALVSLLAIVALAPARPASAARGDCGQPFSSGDSPVASDALVVLKAAVGTASCGICVCDADGGRSVVATDALIVLRAAVGQSVNLTCAACDAAGVSGSVMAPAGSLESGGVGGGDASLATVAGVEVELVEIDGSGTELALLGSTTTDGAGAYSFPTSTGLGSGLLVRALDSAGASVVSALAVDATIDVDPASEFVVGFALGTAMNLAAADASAPGPRPAMGITSFTPAEYNGCVGQARAISPETVPADARDLVELINAATAGLLGEQIAAYAANNDQFDVLSGAYWLLENFVSVEATQSNGQIDVSPDLNQRLTVVGGQTGSLSFDGLGTVTLGAFSGTDFLLSETSGTQRFSDNTPDTKVNATVLIIEEPESDPGGETGAYALAGDGNGVVETGGRDTPVIVNADGSIVGVYVLENVDNYSDRGFGIAFPQASGAGDSLFSGSYHTVDSSGFLEVRPAGGNNTSRIFGSSVATGSVVADGSGGLSATPGAGVDIVLTEDGADPSAPPFDPVVRLTTEPFSAEPSEQLSYAVAANGALTLSAGSEVIGNGAITADGDLVVLHAYESLASEGVHDFSIVIREGSGMTAADLEGDYLFVGLEVFLEAVFTPGSFDGPNDNNLRATVPVSIAGKLELQSGSNALLPVIVGNDAGLTEISQVEFSSFNPGGRVFDAEVFLDSITEGDVDVPGTWSVAANGALSVTVDGQLLTGAAAPDGSFLALQTGGGGGNEATSLFVFAIRRP